MTPFTWGSKVTDPSPWGLDQDADGRLKVRTPASADQSGRGFRRRPCPGRKGVLSPIWQVTEGRWAATSIDRYLQKVSPTAGREKDGPYRTRLFTNLDKTPVVPMVRPADPRAGIYPGGSPAGGAALPAL